MSELFKATIYKRTNLKDLINAKEAAKYIGITEERLLEYSKAGFAPCVVIDGQDYRYFRRDIFNWCMDTLLKVQDAKNISFHVSTDTKPDLFNLPKELIHLSDKLCEYVHDEKPCVYFLLYENEIVYVGQSTLLSNRLQAHKKDKHFTRVLYINVPRELLDSVEQSLIKHLRPKYNGVHREGEFCDRSKETLIKFGYFEKMEGDNVKENCI